MKRYLAILLLLGCGSVQAENVLIDFEEFTHSPDEKFENIVTKGYEFQNDDRFAIFQWESNTLLYQAHPTVTLAAVNGHAFNLRRLDLYFVYSSIPAGTGGASITLTGYYADGRSVSRKIAAINSYLSGTTTTYRFGSAWRNIVLVEFGPLDESGFRSIDNVVIKTPPMLSCQGFDAPLSGEPLEVNKKRTLRLSARLISGDQQFVDDLGLVNPPQVKIYFNNEDGTQADVTEDVLIDKASGEFKFIGSKWRNKLKTRNFDEFGEYTISMKSGNESEYIVDPACSAQVVIQKKGRNKLTSPAKPKKPSRLRRDKPAAITFDDLALADVPGNCELACQLDAGSYRFGPANPQSQDVHKYVDGENTYLGFSGIDMTAGLRMRNLNGTNFKVTQFDVLLPEEGLTLSGYDSSQWGKWQTITVENPRYSDGFSIGVAAFRASYPVAYIDNVVVTTVPER